MPILYAGLDVSLELTSICVITAEGSILKEAKVVSDPEAISSMLLALDGAYERIGLEAGPLSQWLFFGLRDAGLPSPILDRPPKGWLSADHTALLQVN